MRPFNVSSQDVILKRKKKTQPKQNRHKTKTDNTSIQINPIKDPDTKLRTGNKN